MDTLGIDENGCPVIIEYKRASNENVINQGLFYLDWLKDHRGDFELLVLKKLGKNVADGTMWSFLVVLSPPCSFVVWTVRNDLACSENRATKCPDNIEGIKKATRVSGATRKPH